MSDTRRGACSAVLALLVVVPALGQVTGSTPTFPNDPYLSSTPSRADSRPARTLSLNLVRDLRLPGPLPPGRPRVVGDRVEVAVQGGRAVADWTSGEAATVVSPSPDEPVPQEQGPGWVVAPDGRFRYRADPAGWIVAEKRCSRCRAGWRRKWKLRVSGSTLAPPLVTDARVYFGALDNRVYAVRRRNGHRLWDVDVEGRVSSPLVEMTYEAPVPEDPGEAEESVLLEVILVVPEDGSRLLALDADSGRRLAAYTLTEAEGKLKGVPVVTPDGTIIAARQKYAPEEASLMVFRLGPSSDEPAAVPSSAPGTPKSAAAGAGTDLEYNGGTASSRKSGSAKR